MIQDLIEGDVRLICLSISDPTTIKRLVMDLTENILRQRKREFKVKPYVLFVWHEAQEFVASPLEVSGIDRATALRPWKGFYGKGGNTA